MNVGVAGSAPAFKVGDSVTLVRNENGVKTDDIQYGKIQQGVSLNYNLKGMTGSDGKSVNAVVTDKAATEQSKSPVETRVAVTGFINQGADMLDTAAFSSAAVANRAATNNPIVASMGGQRTHIESGSYSVIF